MNLFSSHAITCLGQPRHAKHCTPGDFLIDRPEIYVTSSECLSSVNTFFDLFVPIIVMQYLRDFLVSQFLLSQFFFVTFHSSPIIGRTTHFKERMQR